MDQIPGEAGHAGAGLLGLQPEHQDRFIRLPWNDVVAASPGSLSGSDRRLKDPEPAWIGLHRAQVKPRGPCGARGVVAVDTVDLQSGPRPLIHWTCLRIVIGRQHWALIRCGAFLQAPPFHPTGELVPPESRPCCWSRCCRKTNGQWKPTRQTSEDFGSLTGREVWPVA